MLRHAVWLLKCFQLHSSDQKTSFQRRWGVPFSNPVLPFGELVLAQTQHAESAKLDHRDCSLKEAWLYGLEDVKRPVSTS